MAKIKAHLKLASGARKMLMPTRRDIKFQLDGDKILDWHTAAGPVFTNFLNTFSIVLPIGEKFFIRSVRAYRDQITDPELQKAVTAFIGQEAMHGREHDEYNSAFFAKVPVAPRFEALVQRILEGLSEKAPKAFCLSGTIALEHFTALLADGVLGDERVSAGADPSYAALWRWHALEECEHKAVAYDVWESVMGKGVQAYALRSLGLAVATVVFWGLVTPTFLEVLRSQGRLTDIKGWRKFYRYTFGDIGMLRRRLLPYLDYFKPDFHPWDHDNSEYLKQMDSFLEYQQQLTA